ncbi:monocarboxylate transporter 12 [Elysia marginata]|uniref:Monocarboxylate transporter 12 n=1 Tax=Elysia marginata TaxID=1093978 RepID=A0AAV4HRK8_9GAST|nr:monocarboxylate transporter 12 [Elysia marginata]
MRRRSTRLQAMKIVSVCSSPLSSALTNRYGCRVVTIAGAIVASAGFVMSVWAPNHYYLYLTSGVMAGIGFGLIYLPAIVCVAQYFEKKRSFATGLAVCGSGFGTFVLAPVCKLLIEEYGWRGAMLLLGGFTLNIVVCGIIFRPLEADGAGDKDKGDAEEALKEEEVHLLVNGGPGERDQRESGGAGDAGKPMTAREGMEIISSLQELHALPKGTARLVDSQCDTSATAKTKHSSESACNHAGDSSSKRKQQPSSSSNEADESFQKPRTFSEPFADHVPMIDVTAENSLSSKNKSTAANGSSNIAQISASQCLSPTRAGNNALDIAMLARSDGALHHRLMVNPRDDASGSRPGSKHASKVHLAPLQRKDIFYSGNLLNIPLYRSQPDIYHKQVASSSRSSSVDHRGMLSRTRIDEINNLKERQEKTRGSGVWAELVYTLKDMMSMELLKNPVFLMFGVSNFFTSIGFNMPFIFLPDRAEVAGIDKNRAALLLSVIGIANTVGRMVFGYLSDRPWVNRLWLYNSALAVCGVATAISPSAGGSYEMLVAYAAVFGLFIGMRSGPRIDI